MMIFYSVSIYFFLWYFLLLFLPLSGLFFGGFNIKLKKPGNRKEGNEFATYTDPISQLYRINSENSISSSSSSSSSSTENHRRLSKSMPPEQFASYKDRISQMYLLHGSMSSDGRTFVRGLISENINNVYERVKKIDENATGE